MRPSSGRRSRSRARTDSSGAWPAMSPTIAKPRPAKEDQDPERREDERVARRSRPGCWKPPNRSKPALLNAETAWKTPHHAAWIPRPSRPPTKTTVRTTAPTTSAIEREHGDAPEQRRDARRARGRRSIAWARIRSRRRVRRPTSRNNSRVEPVMNPNPPSWISTSDHHLAERTPVGPGVHDHQPGHADRGRRREEGVQRRRPGPGGRRDRQHQDHASRWR